MKLKWRRLLWLVFIYLYSSIFFYNFLSPFKNWLLVYIYTMILIVWLGVEYYEKRLFFQSGYLPARLYPLPIRTLFALFFYSSFIIGNATMVWWQRNQIGLYPVLQIIGILLLIFSIVLRWGTFNKKTITSRNISAFYLSLMLLIISLTFGYGSQFLILYTLFIGIPLILWQRRLELAAYVKFEDFVHNELNINRIKSKNYAKLWNEYLEGKTKRRAEE